MKQLGSCDGASALKKHGQLLRLMPFLMGLEVFAPVRSQILTIEPLPDVKSDFATLSGDESHRNSYVHNTGTKIGPSAFVTKPNEWTTNKFNNQLKKLNRHKVDERPGQSTSHTFTNVQFQKLIAHTSEKSGSGCIHANITVGHSNGINAHVTHIRCLKLSETITLSDVLVVLDYHVSLLSMHKLPEDNKLRVVLMEISV
ncbi:hypothetical protein Tco_0757503 [Tanacetum coccineum]